MLSHALWQSISSRDCRVITERQSGHPLMYCAGLWDREKWGRGGGAGAELGKGQEAAFALELKMKKRKEGKKQKWLYKQLHHTPLNLTATRAARLLPCSVPSIIFPSNTTLLVFTHTHTNTHTLLTGCHSTVRWLSVSKNLHWSEVGNLKTIVCVVSDNTLSEVSRSVMPNNITASRNTTREKT